ncbi:hypothetical protein CA13_63020 [Planctomycetes bacterium CA13]|uniref:DUF58 domain-containing protein n=1 Tax=Novipirellula herctigrandis TaxID=2527986 RepID=A0A5C5ZDB3_9BACT|nr:hypothetical protein CA13_63020 [Planctomycetes bacterium CA13]
MKPLRNQSLNSPHYRRKIRFTRLGAHFLFVGCFALFGGALRGFNLLLVIAGVLVGALLMQWRWSRSSLVALSIQRRLPEEVFAGQSFKIKYKIRNHSQWMTLWMLRVTDLVSSSNEIGLLDVKATQERIRRGTEASCEVERVARARGLWNFGPIAVSSSFPLDLMTCQIVNEQPETLTVYPKLVKLRRGWQRVLLSDQGGVAKTSQQSGRSEGEFFALRQWQHGDILRWIHWRSTARMNEPVVCQYDQPRRYDLCLLVDAYLPEGSDDESVEAAISFVATVALQLGASGSNRMVVAVAGAEAAAAPAGGTIEDQRRLLRVLAVSKPTARPVIVEALEKAKAVTGRFRNVLVVSPRSQDAAIAAMDDDTYQTIEPFQRRDSLKWINITESEHQLFDFRGKSKPNLEKSRLSPVLKATRG